MLNEDKLSDATTWLEHYLIEFEGLKHTSRRDLVRAVVEIYLGEREPLSPSYLRQWLIDNAHRLA